MRLFQVQPAASPHSLPKAKPLAAPSSERVSTGGRNASRRRGRGRPRRAESGFRLSRRNVARALRLNAVNCARVSRLSQRAAQRLVSRKRLPHWLAGRWPQRPCALNCAGRRCSAAAAVRLDRLNPSRRRRFLSESAPPSGPSPFPSPPPSSTWETCKSGRRSNAPP